jgi:hypothetical protein
MYAPPENPYEDMFTGSASVDLFYQTAEYAYMHAMRAPGQSVEEAQEQMWRFFGEKYFRYKDYLNAGYKMEAYMSLGEALHPIMDWTCPVHNWQEWNPGMKDIYKHVRAEPKTINDRTLKETVELMHDAMKQFDVYYELSQILMMGGLI